MDIEKDIRDHVLATLPCDARSQAELEAKPPVDLLILYLNWRNRLVPSRPRRVHSSRALQTNAKAAAHRSDLDRLVNKITAGEDLTPHLSRRIKTGFESGSPGNSNRRADLDLMLAEWQVHHLHLSSVVEADGFVKRDGPLLFAAIRPDEAYLIDIFGHSDWTREAIARTLIDDWPDCGLVREIPGVLGLSHEPTDAERALRRANGISSPFMMRNGKAYHVGLGGLTSAGTSVIATRQAQQLFTAARAFADYVSTNPQYVADALTASGLTPPQDPDLHLAFTSDGFWVVHERKTNAAFHLGPAR